MNSVLNHCAKYIITIPSRRDFIMQIFVENIRKEKNMSIEELSAVSGVPESQINGIEQGYQNPTIDVVCKLAKALDVPGIELFSAEG